MRRKSKVSKPAPSKRRKPVGPNGVLLLGSSSADETVDADMGLSSTEEEMEDPPGPYRLKGRPYGKLGAVDIFRGLKPLNSPNRRLGDVLIRISIGRVEFHGGAPYFVVKIDTSESLEKGSTTLSPMLTISATEVDIATLHRAPRF